MGTSLRDKGALGAIVARLDRLAYGHAGGRRAGWRWISELRIHFGADYRVYFQKRGDTLIILSCGGDKSSQASNIRRAKRLAQSWSPDHGGETDQF